MGRHFTEHLAGDSRFFVRLEFVRDPDDGQGAQPEDSASWGAFEMTVDGRNLCEHLIEGEPQRAVRWYLLPLLEWLVANWDPLLHEERLPCELVETDAWAAAARLAHPPRGLSDEHALSWMEAGDRWWRRHALFACREGGLFPDVLLRRFRSQVEVSWGKTPIAGTPAGFRFAADPGVARLDPASVAEPLHAVVLAAASSLARELPASRRLATLVRAASALERTPPERRMAWLAGLGDTFKAASGAWHRVAKTIRTSASSAEASAVLGTGASPLVLGGSCHAALMFGSLAPSIRQEDVLSLAKVLIAAHQKRPKARALDGHVRAEPLDSGSGPPWSQGYALAERALTALCADGADRDWVDVESVLQHQGVRLEELELTDETVRALALAGPEHVPTVVLNLACPLNATPQGRRFSLAHELCHLLHDRAHGGPLAIASGPWAPPALERRANAFAAMFLMPTRLVDRAIQPLGHEPTTPEDVSSIADRLRTSVRAAAPHLHNLGRLSRVTLERLAARAPGNSLT